MEEGRAREHEIFDALAAIGDRRALPYAKRELFHPKNAMIRLAAKRAFIALVDRSDIPMIMDMLTLDDLELRMTAIQLLGMLEDAKAVPTLIGIMHDPQAGPAKRSDGDTNRRMRVAVMKALGDIGDPAAIKDLRRYWLMNEARQAIRTIQEAQP